MAVSLVIMAAGLGSRYGGSKQVDGIGPNGEILMEYSIHDALRAGFDKVVFIIKPEMREMMDELVGYLKEKKTAKGQPVQVAYVYQDYTSVPDFYHIPEGRTKPFGTVHALLCAEPEVDGPFCVINADDFYGRDGFRVLGQWLSKADGQNRYCMVGYRVGNTLSESGTVARGICRTDANNYLTGVVERTDIARVDGRITFTGDDGQPTTTDDNTPVSMNMWGFTPDYFRYSEEYFKEFLRANIDNPKAEYYIPLMVNKLITEGTATVEVLDTTAKWFGVTYAADRQGVVDKIRALVDAGEYPAKLF